MKPNKQPKQQNSTRNASNTEMQLMPVASTSSAVANNHQPSASRIEEVVEQLTDPEYVSTHFPCVNTVTKNILKGALVGLIGVIFTLLGNAPDASNLVDSLRLFIMPLNDAFFPLAATVALAATTPGTLNRSSGTTRTASTVPPASTSSQTDPNFSSIPDDPISRLIQEQYTILVNTYAIKFTRYTRTITVGILTLVSSSQIWSFCMKNLNVNRLGPENIEAGKIQNGLSKLELILLESYDQLRRLQQQLVHDKYFDELLFEEFQANVYELRDIKKEISALLNTLKINVDNKVVKLTAKNTFAKRFGQGAIYTGVGMLAIWIVIDVVTTGFHLSSLASKTIVSVSVAAAQVFSERFFTKKELKQLRKMKDKIEKYSVSIDLIDKQVTDLTNKLAELTKQKVELAHQMRQLNGPPQRFSILS